MKSRTHIRKKEESPAMEIWEPACEYIGEDDLLCYEQDILDSIVKKETGAQITELLEQMDEKYKSVIKMHLILQFSLKEIANMKGMEYSTVRSLYSRGIRKLRNSCLSLEGRSPMSKDCKRSYEEVHKKLGEELEKAYLKRETPEEKIPEFDLSFLDEQPYEPTEENDAAREESFISPKEEKKHRFSRFAKVAAVLIIFLLCTNIIMLGRNSTESYGDKGILHRLYQGVTGLFTDSEEETEESDVEEFMTFDRLGEKELKKAKEFLPGLYVPTYIPEGYELDRLEIKKFYSGDYQCLYLYKRDTDMIKLSLLYSVHQDITYQFPEEGTLIELNDRKIFVSKDSVSDRNSIYVCTEELHDRYYGR